ncbi:MAG: RHS repeat-associated core domain-containing protein, partial [Deltaproteobacteria bacterium]|nr:RHS repeat-associated core domain-containing protein [Deltaproteobacteria bacterium]
VTTAAITPGQMNFQVQYQLGQNAEQNKKNTDLSILQTQVADALPHDELPLLIPKGSLRDKEGSGKVDRQPQIVVSYDYDAINRMVGRQTQDGADTTSTQWAYFDLMRTVEYNNNRALSQLEFFHGTNGIDYLIPKSARDQTGQIPPAKGLALHKDKLGSTVMVTNEERGEVEEQIFFTPNGEVVVRNHGVDYPVSKTGNPILFTGQYYDAAVALYLFPYRAMDADQGRFLQRDPIGVADGPNTYTYANNSPFNFTDPLGLAKKSASEVKLHIILGPGHDDEGIMFAAAADTLMNRAMEAGVEGTIEHPVTGQDFADIINAIGKSGGNKTKLIVILAHSGPRLEGIQSAGLFLFQNQGYYPYGYEKSEPGSATLADLNAGALQNCVVFVAGCNSAVGGAQSLAMSFMDPKLEAHRVIGTGGTAGFVTAGGREIPKEKFGQTLQSGADVYMAAPGLAAFGRGANGDIVARVRPNNVLASEIINLTMNMIRSLGATPQNGSPRHGRAHPGRSRGASDT